MLSETQNITDVDESYFFDQSVVIILFCFCFKTICGLLDAAQLTPM